MPKRRTVPRNQVIAEKEETPQVAPQKIVVEEVVEVAAPSIVVEEVQEESPFLECPVEVELIEGASFRDGLSSVLFVKNRPLQIVNRDLVLRCSQSSRFRVG